ncbi:hypothetical protein [Desulfosporosinus shakirovi]|uniref:hypothetical protein n=1 Tax=Desulfosporosinus shakirovi TaxID=2885154 RepID=UPI001E43C359|nr:hypothetical protein [Desulfosporosinus sp. SRJS8]MCB8817385.1 hypothetical protein [Desulfosporosinus sp. SRJS8]
MKKVRNSLVLFAFLLISLSVFSSVGCNRTSSPVSSQPQRQPRLVFSEKVDEKITPINTGIIFNSGKVEVTLQASSAFEVSKLQVTIYRTGTAESVYHREDVDVDPKWGVYHFGFNFTEKGKYRVAICKLSGETLGEGEVEIK